MGVSLKGSAGRSVDRGRLAAVACIAAVVVAAALSASGAARYLPLGLSEAPFWFLLVEPWLLIALAGALSVALALHVAGPVGLNLATGVGALLCGVCVTGVAGVLLIGMSALVSIATSTMDIDFAIGARVGDVLALVLSLSIILAFLFIVASGIRWMCRRVRAGDRRAALGLVATVVGIIILTSSQAYLFDLERRVLAGESSGVFGEDVSEEGPNGIQMLELSPIAIGIPFGVGVAVSAALLARRGLSEDSGAERASASA